MITALYGRAPLINHWKIKQLKTLVRETQKMIADMKQHGAQDSEQLFYERQLLLIFQNSLREYISFAINSEFSKQDYFSRLNLRYVPKSA